ncbi:MAG: twin-arginine translocase subunit TatC [Muribaculaceae bacterium]|nr:twin-arginine translocase subunit TatC [Muribaculaceae bacterium]
MAQQEESGFWTHVEALRRLLLRMVAAVMVLAIALFAAMPWIFDHIIAAPCRGDFILYRWLAMAKMAGGAWMPDLGDPDFSVSLINIELASQFFVHMTLSFYLAVILAFPYLLFEIWRFISPALYEQEKRGTRWAFFFGCLLFYMGMTVGYLVIFPLTLRFLADYELSSMIDSTVSLTSYMDSFYAIVLLMGVVFEVPIVAWLLGRIGLLRREFFTKYRRHAIVAILVLAALLTPTGDPFSLTVIFLPIYALWEASALLVPKGDKQ